MFVSEYITKDYPAFEGSDLVESAFETARDFGFSHIFVIKNGSYAGAISQTCLEENIGSTIDSLEPYYEQFAATEDSDVTDTIRLFYTFASNVIPILGKNEKYLGYISAEDVFEELSKYPIFNENGEIITLQATGKYYSLSEVVNILEGNNAKVYGCYISSINDDGVQITMKISSENLRSIDETFERYGYHIVHKSYQNEKEELIQERFSFFQKYLEF